jgi:DNA helicase-2/ATP-dependent DNA helicase PcrA
MVAADTAKMPDRVEPESEEWAIICEEQEILTQVQRALAERELGDGDKGEYDKELVALRDQISEARAEDVAPLVAEMYRLQALGARTGNGRALPVDPDCPYFGHLILDDGKKRRHVLIGNSGWVPTKTSGLAIVDWRHAPVSRIYYRYDEGEDFEEHFGGRLSTGNVLARRTVTITDGGLRRITWSKGAVARRRDGSWVRVSVGQRPSLAGGAGTAARPAPINERPDDYKAGMLGVVGDESLREDKHLKAITGLIDKAQFDLITRPDSGIVILQGGAGSGKTTVALHRAAYLHYQKPQVFSQKKMAVVVKSPALTEYISRVLPSLGVPPIAVVTLEGWMRRTRQKILPQLDRPRVDDVPRAVARLKKHPAVLHLMEWAVQEEARAIGDDLVVHLEGPIAKSVAEKWNALARLALLPRVREMGKWLESAAAARAGLDARGKKAALGVLRRARATAGEVESTWAQVLTDFSLLREAIDARTPDQVGDDELRELVDWVSMQSEEIEQPDEEDADEDEAAYGAREKKRGDRRKARREAEHAAGVRGGADHDGGADDDGLLRGIGVDGLHVEDDTARGRFDEHDDALLLRLTQLKHGGLPIPGSSKTLHYEHVVVDEAQDLSPTDVAVLKGAMSSRESMTLAGDTAQKLVFDNGFTDWKDLMADVGVSGVEMEPLRISYRSTREIMGFARHVLGPLADPIEPVATRSGAPVEPFVFGTTGEAIAFLGESLRSLMMREKRASVAVIARYAAQADIYYDGLRNSEVPALRRVYGKEFSFAPGVDVVDVAQIKGLEYDYVILVEVNESTYPETNEARHLLHIAATRGVYQLWATSVGRPSTLLPDEL